MDYNCLMQPDGEAEDVSVPETNLNSFHPVSDVEKRSLVGTVIHQQHAVSTAEVRFGDTPEPAQITKPLKR